jgi:glutathione S-transferase
MLKTLTDQLARGAYLLGDRFSAADVLWGGALRWTTRFKLVPETPLIADYVARVTSRPSFVRAAKIDADLLAARGP